MAPKDQAAESTTRLTEEIARLRRYLVRVEHAANAVKDKPCPHTSGSPCTVCESLAALKVKVVRLCRDALGETQ